MLDFLIEQAERDIIAINDLLKGDSVKEGGIVHLLAQQLFDRQQRVDLLKDLQTILSNKQTLMTENVSEIQALEITKRRLYDFYSNWNKQITQEGKLKMGNIKKILLDTCAKIDDALKVDCDIVEVRCPISGEPFRDPVIAQDGHTYERESIVGWIVRKQSAHQPVTSPMTNEVMDVALLPNYAVIGFINHLSQLALQALPVAPQNPVPEAGVEQLALLHNMTAQLTMLTEKVNSLQASVGALQPATNVSERVERRTSTSPSLF